MAFVQYVISQRSIGPTRSVLDTLGHAPSAASAACSRSRTRRQEARLSSACRWTRKGERSRPAQLDAPISKRDRHHARRGGVSVQGRPGNSDASSAKDGSPSSGRHSRMPDGRVGGVSSLPATSPATVDRGFNALSVLPVEAAGHGVRAPSTSIPKTHRRGQDRDREVQRRLRSRWPFSPSSLPGASESPGCGPCGRRCGRPRAGPGGGRYGPRHGGSGR